MLLHWCLASDGALRLQWCMRGTKSAQLCASVAVSRGKFASSYKGVGRAIIVSW